MKREVTPGKDADLMSAINHVMAMAAGLGTATWPVDRIEAALNRHGDQPVIDHLSGRIASIVPYGAPLQTFREELARMKGVWITAVEACRVTP